MTAFFNGATIVLGLLLFLPLYRLAKGPTIYDRLVATAVMGTKTTVLLLLLGYAIDREDMFVDISIGYGLALLVGTLMTAKYLEVHAAETGHAGGPEERLEPRRKGGTR